MAGPIVIHPDVHGAVEELAPARRSPPSTVPRPIGPTPTGKAPSNLGARILSLDALRGLFLVAMIFGFTLSTAGLPDWMQHRQLLPDGTIVDQPGVNWRDLTYVAFLFTMAAAMPVTLSRRIARGAPELSILWWAVRRYVTLMVFALLVGHSNTYFIGYTNTARALAITAFVIMMFMYTRPRPEWKMSRPGRWKNIGWLLAFAFLILSPLAYDGRFAVDRIDSIIAGLAFASFSGAIVWYFTRHRLAARLLVLAAVVGLYALMKVNAPVAGWWYSTPLPWTFQFSELALLMVVIPGTIAGDALVRWSLSDATAAETSAVGVGRALGLMLVALAAVPVIVVGSYTGQPVAATLAGAVVVLLGLAITWRGEGPNEQLLRSLFRWASVWFLLGLLVAPIEGGMRKIPENVSYFFGVTGVSMMLLVAFAVVVDMLRARRGLKALVDVGQNPLMAYVVYTLLINPVVDLVPGVRDILTGSPVQLLGRSALETLLAIAIVGWAARRRILWRT